MAKTSKGKPAFASLNPDDMMQGGLPSDFRGTVSEADYVKWDYEGTVDQPVLAVRLTIVPAEGEEVNQGKPIVQHWSAGNLKDWEPGDEEGDAAEEGPYAIRVGKRAEMNNNTNFAHLMKSILECGSAAKGKPFTGKQLSEGTGVHALKGLDAQWVRVPQQKRSGMVDLNEAEEGEEKSSRPSKKDILVATEVFGYDPDYDGEPAPAAKKSGKTTKPAKDEDEPEAEDDEDEVPAKPAKKPAKKPPVEEDDEPEAEAEEAEEADADEVSPADVLLAKNIAKAIKAAGGTLKKGKLATLMLKAYATAKPKEKSAAVERCTEEDFLSDAARPWEFDEDTGILTL